MMLLGTDNDMEADWDNGVFYDNFRGVWGAIDGHMVYMELAYDGEDYNLYSVPILLNGEAYNLQVAYDFTAEEWSILGASQGLDDTGMASKELRLLEAGDQITTIWQMSTYSGDDDFEMYAAEEFTVTDQTAFSETALPTETTPWSSPCRTPPETRPIPTPSPSSAKTARSPLRSISDRFQTTKPGAHVPMSVCPGFFSVVLWEETLLRSPWSWLFYISSRPALIQCFDLINCQAQRVCNLFVGQFSQSQK